MSQLNFQIENMDEFAAQLPERSDGAPTFRLAWHTRAFALIVALVKQNTIPWRDFQSRLVDELKVHQNAEELMSDEDIDLQYFNCWLAALEHTLVAKGFVNIQDIAAQIALIEQTVAEIRDDQMHS